jgi:hypothetical protein
MKLTKRDWMAIGALDYLLAEALENNHVVKWEYPITVEPCEMPLHKVFGKLPFRDLSKDFKEEFIGGIEYTIKIEGK